MDISRRGIQPNQGSSGSGKSDAGVFAEWKAGFIEDCDDLHLLRKPMFASIVNEWLVNGTDKVNVVTNLKTHAPGGEKRQSRIASEVAAVVEIVKKQYK
jgi:hypothetical protein